MHYKSNNNKKKRKNIDNSYFISTFHVVPRYTVCSLKFAKTVITKDIFSAYIGGEAVIITSNKSIISKIASSKGSHI